jgi:magnesium chelatase subunit I
MKRPVFPFAAIEGQDELKTALLLCAVDPMLGGVLAFGDRGTGKSTAARGLAALLPPIRANRGCKYRCDPANPDAFCDDCVAKQKAGTLRAGYVRVPVVDLPLGATEDRIVGALDIEKALRLGAKAFETGLLAAANRGFLYIDEVNLLEDHLVDLLLDVAASGENTVERDGLSLRHPARFVLIGSGNPEEGELRPQLLDRFGLSVEVVTPTDLPLRIEIVKRRDAYDRDPAAFVRAWRKDTKAVRRSVHDARSRLEKTRVPDALLHKAAKLCIAVQSDGLRGELTLMRAARALAALEGAATVRDAHLKRVAPSALRHRLRRDPLDEAGSTVRVELALQDVFA